jgi:predicted NodU family carbamoyl transferase
MKKFKFKGFLAPPCINDSGISLGIALYVFYKRLSKKKVDFKLAHPFYGDKNLLSTDGLEVYSQYIKESSEFDLDVVLNDLETGPFIWFDGRAEIGPRALGNRSLFADPRNNKSKDELNRIKQRQWWRPVAPIILEEEISNWFENSYPSPFMLHTFKVNKDKEKYVPAILHLDKTARVQTIKSESNNQLIYRIIKGFYNKTGVPIICNTSLNDNGEPIINSFHEAMNFALRKNIRIVYFNGQRFELMNHEKYKNTQPLQRNKKFFEHNNVESVLKKYNPFNLPMDVVDYYYNVSDLFMNFSLSNEKDVEYILKQKKIIDRIIKLQ